MFAQLFSSFPFSLHEQIACADDSFLHIYCNFCDTTMARHEGHRLSHGKAPQRNADSDLSIARLGMRVCSNAHRYTLFNNRINIRLERTKWEINYKEIRMLHFTNHLAASLFYANFPPRKFSTLCTYLRKTYETK